MNDKQFLQFGLEKQVVTSVEWTHGKRPKGRKRENNAQMLIS